MADIATYFGKPITEMSREELIEVINVMTEYYESRRAQHDKAIDFMDCALKQRRKHLGSGI